MKEAKQLNLFDYIKQIITNCKYSGHKCNCTEIWKVADTLDDIKCPHICCRLCDQRLCGARCNGSK